jgi:hypothetical protein
MSAPITVELDNPLKIPRRNALEQAQIETLFFVDLNADTPASEPPERELPEELTGFYYTG